MVRTVGLRELAGRRDGRGRGRWQPASIQVVELSLSITCKAFTHTTCSTPRPHYFGRVRGRPGSVGVGYAGMSQMQTLVTRLGGELTGYGRIAAVHFSTAPGAGGSQCAYGGRTQEQAARSAGVRRPKVTVLRGGQWAVGSGQAVGNQWN